MWKSDIDKKLTPVVLVQQYVESSEGAEVAERCPTKGLLQVRQFHQEAGIPTR
jgi:hypothetical protein